MKSTKIAVDYPTTLKVIIKTEAEAKAMGYKSEIARYENCNRPQRIQVKQVKRLVQEEFMTSEDYENELEDMSKAQTGMGRSAYQAKHGKAWNE